MIVDQLVSSTTLVHTLAHIQRICGPLRANVALTPGGRRDCGGERRAPGCAAKLCFGWLHAYKGVLRHLKKNEAQQNATQLKCNHIISMVIVTSLLPWTDRPKLD